MTERSRDPSSNLPLNGPDVPIEQKVRQLAGERDPEDQAAFIDRSDVEDLGGVSPTDIYEGELPSGDDDLIDDSDDLELLTELELRDGETDDVMEAIQEGLTYIPPIDPPTVPSDQLDNAEVASGLGVSALDEPYDDDHHDTLLPEEDEVSDRVREAIRADSSTSPYADTIRIVTNGAIVRLRGLVDDLVDSDNLVAVAERVAGVEEVIDELRVRGIG